MKLPYRPYRVRLYRGEPFVTVWRPMVQTLLHGPLGTAKLNALLDCGADQTMFPRQFADALGIAVDDSRPGNVRGVGGAALTVHPGHAELEIRDGRQGYRWPSTIQFGPGNHVLLGQLGCLEFFVATLDHHGRLLTLTPNSAFPGSR